MHEFEAHPSSLKASIFDPTPKHVDMEPPLLASRSSSKSHRIPFSPSLFLSSIYQSLQLTLCRHPRHPALDVTSHLISEDRDKNPGTLKPVPRGQIVTNPPTLASHTVAFMLGKRHRTADHGRCRIHLHHLLNPCQGKRRRRNTGTRDYTNQPLLVRPTESKTAQVARRRYTCTETASSGHSSCCQRTVRDGRRLKVLRPR